MKSQYLYRLPCKIPWLSTCETASLNINASIDRPIPMTTSISQFQATRKIRAMKMTSKVPCSYSSGNRQMILLWLHNRVIDDHVATTCRSPTPPVYKRRVSLRRPPDRRPDARRESLPAFGIGPGCLTEIPRLLHSTKPHRCGPIRDRPSPHPPGSH